MSNVKLTTMCMIYNDDGSFLVQNRIKNDWPGINFPGGKVEKLESIYESCIREIKEETNLDIKDLVDCGYYEWNDTINDIRHLCILFKTNNYSGTLMPSKEGECFFIKEEDIKNYKISIDFDKVYLIIKNNG